MKHAPKKQPAEKLKAMDAASATAHMEGLIAAHEATAQDGRLEVATAIAMTSDTVTVNASAQPFTTKPENLFNMAFSEVGIDTADLVSTFLANLKSLLPKIASDLDQIPPNPAMKVQQVASFVLLALLQGE